MRNVLPVTASPATLAAPPRAKTTRATRMRTSAPEADATTTTPYCNPKLEVHQLDKAGGRPQITGGTIFFLPGSRDGFSLSPTKMRPMVQGRVCGARAAAILAHTVSLGVGVLRALLERAIWLFSIVDMTSVNGAAFRQLRVACETHTGVFDTATKRAAARAGKSAVSQMSRPPPPDKPRVACASNARCRWPPPPLGRRPSAAARLPSLADFVCVEGKAVDRKLNLA
eukprot:scaffold5181_cov125-Isochrysis_galbana.AAC.4